MTRQKTLQRNGNWRLVYKEPKGMRIQWRRDGRWTAWPGKPWFIDYSDAFKTYNALTQSPKFIIQDWAGNVLFNGREFESFV